MNKKRWILALGLALVMVLAGCGDNSATEAPKTDAPGTDAAATDAPSTDAPATEGGAGEGLTGPISVVSREDGSGTRGAFVEIVGVMVDKNDATVDTAIIQNGTDAVMTTVGNTPDAIGYISLGSLNDTVKALQIDGVDATDDNIKAGTYPIARPFHIATKGEPNELAKDFIEFMMSKDGQDIAGEHYISADDGAAAFTVKEGLKGNIQVGGSTSVAPLVEKMAEKYMELNPDVIVDIQATGSTPGMTAAKEGVVDIGMASRDLSEEELKELTPTVIARDGIAVIVNKENPLTTVSLESVKQIYLGEMKNWEEVK